MLRRVSVVLLSACVSDPMIKAIDSDPPVPVDTDPAVVLDVPDIEISPTALRFPSLPLECVTDPLPLVITNVGTAALHLQDIEIRGGGVAAFTVQMPRNPTIAPGDSRTLDVAFVPHQYATYEPKVVVSSDDPDEPTKRVDLWGQGSEAAFQEEVFVQDTAAKVDVLWLIDDSGSMSEEKGKLVRSFDAFVSTFVNLGLDYHVAVAGTSDEGTCAQFRGPMLTSAMPAADAIAEFSRQANLSTGCGEESGFDGSRGALTDASNLATGFLRADATLAVVTVSDEEEQASDNISPRNFATWLASLKGGDASRVSFSAMTGPDGSVALPLGCPLASGADAERAPRYHAAIRAAGGVWGNLCKFEVRPFLQNLSYVAAGLAYSFPLGTEPLSTSPSAITVTVDGQVVPFGITDGWTFDVDTNSVELHGAAIPDPGAVILVRYPYDPGC